MNQTESKGNALGADRIEKGTLVRVRTNNGGEIFGHLLETYVPTYRAVVGRMNALTGGFASYAVIEAARIKSIEGAPLRSSHLGAQ